MKERGEQQEVCIEFLSRLSGLQRLWDHLSPALAVAAGTCLRKDNCNADRAASRAVGRSRRLSTGMRDSLCCLPRNNLQSCYATPGLAAYFVPCSNGRSRRWDNNSLTFCPCQSSRGVRGYCQRDDETKESDQIHQQVASPLSKTTSSLSISYCTWIALSFHLLYLLYELIIDAAFK